MLDRDDQPEIPAAGPLPRRLPGATGLEVTPLRFGTAPLGNVNQGETYGVGPGGALDGLLTLRDEGLVEHIGIAEGGVELARRYVATGVFAAMITHNRWTLVDRSAGPLIEDAAERDPGISNAAVFGGGILVRGAEASRGRYAYHQVSDLLLEHIAAMGSTCEEHGVPLPAAALRFSLRNPASPQRSWG